MYKISSLCDFPPLFPLAAFSGKTHEDAVNSAKAWAKDSGATLLSYFEQKPINSKVGILVSYRARD